MATHFPGLSTRRRTSTNARPVRFVLSHKNLRTLDTLEQDLSTLRALPGVTVVATHARTCLVQGPRTLKEMRELLSPLRGWTAFKEHFCSTAGAPGTPRPF